MPVGKGSIERAVKAKNAAEKAPEAKKTAEKKPAAKKPAAKKASAKKVAEPVVVQENVIAATSPEVMELVTGKKMEKAVKIGDPMPEWML